VSQRRHTAWHQVMALGVRVSAFNCTAIGTSKHETLLPLIKDLCGGVAMTLHQQNSAPLRLAFFDADPRHCDRHGHAYPRIGYNSSRRGSSVLVESSLPLPRHLPKGSRSERRALHCSTPVAFTPSPGTFEISARFSC
jgi:hypothetical protein